MCSDLCALKRHIDKCVCVRVCSPRKDVPSTPGKTHISVTHVRLHTQVCRIPAINPKFKRESIVAHADSGGKKCTDRNTVGRKTSCDQKSFLVRYGDRQPRWVQGYASKNEKNDVMFVWKSVHLSCMQWEFQRQNDNIILLIWLVELEIDTENIIFTVIFRIDMMNCFYIQLTFLDQHPCF